MVSEEHARDLLARAAATIDVDDRAPMTLTGLPDERRRWPLLVAIAAAVALVAGLGYGAARLVGDDASDPEPTVSGEPIEREHVYGDDEMPSLVGYSREEAIAELNDRGLLAATSRVPDECFVVPAGHVISTHPAPGAPVAVGETVTVDVVGSSAGGDLCVRPPAGSNAVFELLRFARGLAPPPDFPGSVSLAVGEGDYVELTAEAATDPDNWTVCEDQECHSALAALAEIVTRPASLNGRFVSTHLDVTNDLGLIDGGDGCLTADPFEQALPYHRPTYVRVETPHDGGMALCEPPVLQIGWSEDRRIASVRLRLPLPVEDITEPELDAGLGRIAAAQAFVAWARGDAPAPAFAGRVRNFLPGLSPPWNTNPEFKDGWSGCSGIGVECAINPVGVIAGFRGHVEINAGPSECGPTPEFGAPEDVVHVASRSNASCRGAVAVELWIDDGGRIYGVRQIFTEAR